VAGSTSFTDIQAQVSGRSVGSVELSTPATAWLSVAVQTANDQSYRFDLRELHGAGEPRLVDLGTERGVGEVAGLHLGRRRGTEKLVVLLGVDGEGSAAVGASGVSETVELRTGALVVAPAFLDLSVTRADALLRCIVTTAQGPAFR
jgi:hypothetical protein